jgi:hypothetical protein
MHTITTQIITDLNSSNFVKYPQNIVRNCWMKEKERKMEGNKGRKKEIKEGKK